MSSFWPMLESWTTQQDYVWFLALLAWSGVLAAELRRSEPTARVRMSWLAVFAASAVLGFIIQLVLLAQDLSTPYLKFDFAMGAMQAAGTAALGWRATDTLARPRLWRAIGASVLFALACARWIWPVSAGLGLCLVQTATVLALLRKNPRAIPFGVGTGLIVLPLIATHGPWAYAIGHGRRNVDWSHFALAEAGCWLVLGAWLSISAWRRLWAELARHHGNTERLQRDFRRAVTALAVWLVCGLGLAVWSGRQSRRAYENYLLRRVELMLELIDTKALVHLLGPELRITKVELRHFPDGEPVEVATTPTMNSAEYRKLITQFERLRQQSPELSGLAVHALRQNEVVLFSFEPRSTATDTHNIFHHATKADYDAVAARKAFVTGPTRSNMIGTRVEAYVPIPDPNTGEVLGWFVGKVTGTMWAASFMLARLQTMALVGVGVGFWTLFLAYRLRREARDEAERKAAESAAADRLKSTFLAKVSHELRTPIQSVLGYGELLANTHLPKPQGDWVSALRSHGTIMLRLVNDLIDLGALQSGAFRLELGPVDLRAIVDECLLAVRPAADRKRLELVSSVAPEVPAWVKGDGVRLRQVLLNLAGNAVKYTPVGSVRVRIEPHESEIDFIVTDTGPGIPAGLRSELFKPFARLDTKTATGSGLGLALVHGLVQVMGGEVWLDDNQSAGATFVVRLPLSPTAGPEPKSLREAAKTFLAGTSVLIAEDNTLVRQLLVTFLEQHGATVHLAEDGIAAQELATSLRPDVLLLDIGLPGRDGITVAERLRADGLHSLRIIGLSAHAGPQEEARARMAGMNDFLIKPVSFEKLTEALQSHTPLDVPSATIQNEQLRTTLVAQFAEETPHVLEQMRSAVAAENWSVVRSRAHYLKNSADVIGASGLQDACRQLMAIDGQPDPKSVYRLFTAVLAAVPTTTLSRQASDLPGADDNRSTL